MEGPRQAPCERQASSQWDPPLWTPLPGPYVSKRANAVAAVMAGEDWLAVCRAYGGVYCMPPALLPPATHTGAMSKRDWETEMAAWRAAIRREQRSCDEEVTSFHAAEQAPPHARGKRGRGAKRPRLRCNRRGATVAIFGPWPVAMLGSEGFD